MAAPGRQAESAPKAGSRRERILRATLGLLATTPLERLTTRAIASAVGLTQPALFRHFPSREALLVAVVDAARGEIQRAVAPALGAARAPLDACLALAEALAGYVDRQPGLPRLLFADLTREEPALRRALHQLASTQRALVTGLVVAAIGDGTARPDVDARAAATLFVGMLQGLALERDLAGPGAATLAERVVPVSRLWRAALASANPVPVQAPEPSRRAAIVKLDVTPLFARGADPMARVLAEVDGMRAGSLLVVIAPFRAAPLEAALASRGHAVRAVEGPGGSSNIACVVGGAPEILDLRDLEPPEPLVRVLSLSSKLAAGGVILAHVPRLPRVLLAELARRGLPHEVVELSDGTALVRVAAP